MLKPIRLLLAASLLICGIASGGCGQKGALVLPEGAGDASTVDPGDAELPESIDDLVDDIENRKPS